MTRQKYCTNSITVALIILFIGLPVLFTGCMNTADSRENCRLFGATLWQNFSPDELRTILDTFRKPSHPQSNGWSLSIYSNYDTGGNLSIPGVPMIIRSEKNVEHDLETFVPVTSLCIRLHPDIILGHLRNASSGCSDIADPHPFQRELNGKHFLFIHNGGVWGDDLELLVGKLLENEADPQCCPDTPIDSEYLFIYLLNLMKKTDQEPFDACRQWVRNLMKAFTTDWNALNVILTDGDKLWAVRCSYRNDRFPLHYHELNDRHSYAISTQAQDRTWIALPNFSVSEFRQGTRPKIALLETMNPDEHLE